MNMLPYTSKGRDLGLQNHQLHNYPELARAHEYDLVGVVVHVGSIDTGKSPRAEIIRLALSSKRHWVR